MKISPTALVFHNAVSNALLSLDSIEITEDVRADELVLLDTAIKAVRKLRNEIVKRITEENDA